MRTVTWDQCRSVYENDYGALINLKCYDTDVSHWERLLTALKASSFNITCERDGEKIDFPKSAAWALAEHLVASMSLSIDMSSVIANCYFFCDYEIEFDLDPREIKSEIAFNSAVSLMQLIASSTDLPVFAMNEGAGRGFSFLKVSPNGDTEYTPYLGEPGA